MEPLVIVVIVTWNGREHLQKCLPSLRQTTHPNFRVILVDNGSKDESVGFVRKFHPEVSLICNEQNLGFARGNNVGINAALAQGAEYVALLNDDTVVLDPQWISAAVEVAERDPIIGMVGFELRDQIELPVAAQPLSVTNASHIPGCALFIRGELLRRIGLFDPTYFAYYEEDDLEARAIRAGYKLVCLNVPLYHRGEGTSERTPVRAQYLTVRNAIRYSLKNRSFCKTLLRSARLFDICCNPRPFSMNRSDVSHRRARGRGNIFANFFLFGAAIVWNIVFLPATLARAAAERRVNRRHE